MMRAFLTPVLNSTLSSAFNSRIVVSSLVCALSVPVVAAENVDVPSTGEAAGVERDASDYGMKQGAYYTDYEVVRDILPSAYMLYARYGVGVTTMSSVDGKSVGDNFDSSVRTEFGVQYFLSERLSASAGLVLQQDAIDGLIGDGKDFVYASYGLSLSADYSMPLTRKLDWYVGADLGYLLTDVDSFSTTLVDYTGETSSGIEYGIHGGMKWEFSLDWQLDMRMGYQQRDMGYDWSSRVGSDAGIDIESAGFLAGISIGYRL